jgi:hypothetical protein
MCRERDKAGRGDVDIYNIINAEEKDDKGKKRKGLAMGQARDARFPYLYPLAGFLLVTTRVAALTFLYHQAHSNFSSSLFQPHTPTMHQYKVQA